MKVSRMSNKVVMACLLLVGCGDSASKLPPPKKPNSATIKATSNVELPEFIIAERSTLLGSEKVVVLLNERVDEWALTAIAHHLNPTSKKLYIFYKVHHADEDRVPWATSHFNPNLQVDVMGITAGDWQKLISLPDLPTSIGSWIVEGAFGSRMDICKTPVGYNRVLRFPSSDPQNPDLTGTELSVSDHPNGQRFEEPDDPHGEYEVLTSKGELERYSPDGKWQTLQPVRKGQR